MNDILTILLTLSGIAYVFGGYCWCNIKRYNGNEGMIAYFIGG